MEPLRDAYKALGYVIIAGVVVAWGIILFTGEEKRPLDLADGVYASPCCGRLELRSGQARYAIQTFRYVIEQDKAGPYVLPVDSRVTVEGDHLKIDGSDSALKLYLDAATRPGWIEIYGDGGRQRFVRESD